MQFFKKHKNALIPRKKEKWSPRIEKCAKSLVTFCILSTCSHLKIDHEYFSKDVTFYVSNLMKIELLVVFKFVGDNLHYDQILKIILVAHSNNLSL